MLPCQKRIDAECFRHNPEWAKQVLAYRLIHLIMPKGLTRRLPKGLRGALIAAGVAVPPGLVLPDGTVVGPGTTLPSTWSPGDPVPPGIIITTGTVFPAGWTVSDPVPEGVTLEPGATFPAAWSPPDPTPDGLLPAPSLPPKAKATGAKPPAHLDPNAPGPINQPGRNAPAACPDPGLNEPFTGLAHLKYSTQDVHTAFVTNVATWYSFLHGGNSGNNYLWTDPGYVTLYTELLNRDNYIYVQDTDTFNIRCSTEIVVQSKKTVGGGLKAEIRLYNGQPPTGTLLWSDNLNDSTSTSTETFTHGLNLAGYSNLYLCIYVFDIRRQRIYKVQVLA